MANEALLIKGTKLTLMASGALVSNGGFAECTSDDRQPGENAGYPLGIFEFTPVGTFAAAPTAGAVINVYEQKINSDGVDSPDVSSGYKNDFIGSFPVPAVDAATPLNPIVAPIHVDGGKYWIGWVDGGAGVTDISATWKLTMTPATYGT